MYGTYHANYSQISLIRFPNEPIYPDIKIFVEDKPWIYEDRFNLDPEEGEDLPKRRGMRYGYGYKSERPQKSRHGQEFFRSASPRIRRAILRFLHEFDSDHLAAWCSASKFHTRDIRWIVAARDRKRGHDYRRFTV